MSSRARTRVKLQSLEAILAHARGPILSFRARGVYSKGPIQNFLDCRMDGADHSRGRRQLIFSCGLAEDSCMLRQELSGEECLRGFHRKGLFNTSVHVSSLSASGAACANTRATESGLAKMNVW